MVATKMPESVYLASTYNDSSYGTSSYNGTSTTGTGTSTTSATGGTSPLTNTGFDLVAIVTVAALVLLVAVVARIWKRSVRRD